MKREAFEAAVSRLLDGEISPEDFAELEQYLENSEEAREHYLDFVDLHNVLDLEHSLPRVVLGASDVVPVERILKRQKRRSFRQSALAAAALLVLLGVVLKLVLVPEPDPLLSFRAAPDSILSVTHFTMEGEDPAPGVLAEGSRLLLTQGTVELTLATGVVSIVQSPADLTLHSEERLHLNKGTAWFRVPKGAEGFQVQTRDVLVTDLGTEFGVISTHTALDEVHVFKGRVKVQNRNGLENLELLSGRTARIVGAAGRLKDTPVRPKDFLTVLPSSLPHVHLSFDAIEGDRLNVSGNHRDVPDITARFVKSAGESNSAPLVPGRLGQALQLTGKGDFVFTDWPGISGKRTRTVACWVRMPEGAAYDPAAAIVGWGAGRNNGKWKIHAAPESQGKNGPDPGDNNRGLHPRISLGPTWFHAPSVRLDDGRWHHLAAVSYGHTDDDGLPALAIFLDGKRLPLVPYTDPGAPAPAWEVDTITDAPEAVPLLVGASGSVNRRTFKGEIDELYIFDGALTDESIRQLAAGKLPNQND